MEYPTDEQMRSRLQGAKRYTAVILRKTAKRVESGMDAIIWEHGRRNFALREAGLLAIVCPVNDESDVSGIGIFTGTPDEVRVIMDDDPGVRAGIFTYEVHATRGFPGDALPA
ncbi:MAG TPA: hypothetical protein VIJ18_00975 [Microbacteriaceae bacterium]